MSAVHLRIAQNGLHETSANSRARAISASSCVGRQAESMTKISSVGYSANIRNVADPFAIATRPLNETKWPLWSGQRPHCESAAMAP